MTKISIEDIKYMFTRIGGGWGYNHDLYIITKDDNIYYTGKFNENTLVNTNVFEVSHLGHLYNDVENKIVSNLFTRDSNGKSINQHTYLFDLLDKDGKVNFEDFKVDNCMIMDSPYYTLYKNENDSFKILVNRSYNGGNIPAIKYTLALVDGASKLF